MNIQKIREDFTVLQRKINGRQIIYFDNACMSLKPKQVVNKVNEYYNEYPACAERSYHKLGKKATEEYEESRKIIRKFINARSDKEIIFTKNTTESINLVAHSYKFYKLDSGNLINPGAMIINTDKEHNSNLIPWQIVINKNNRNKSKNFRHAIITTRNGFDMTQLEKVLRENKGKSFVSMVHTSNMDGSTMPAKEIIKLAHDYKAKVLLDCAQSIPHKRIDVKKLDADFIAFSGHKMLGPTGTGVLYGKEESLEELEPFLTGGSTVDESTYDTVQFTHLPERFEAGLQNYAGFIGLGEAVKYLTKYIDDIEQHENKLNILATNGLKDVIDILGPQDPLKRGGILSFNAKQSPSSKKGRMDYHEIAMLLDSYANIMIRSGRHCVHSWFNTNGIDGSARASFYLYNTEEEVRLFIEKVREIVGMK